MAIALRSIATGEGHVMQFKDNKLNDKPRFFQGPTTRRYIVKNPENNTFEEYYDNNEYILAERFYRKIKAETNWFENLITHNPTIGTFYEDLLRNTLSEFAPKNNIIGTGFVYDSEMETHSKQIDILIYDDSDRSVLYRNGEFVIVYPGSVLSVTEVKKTIGTSELKNVVRTTFFNSMGSYSKNYSGIQKLNIFAYSLSCKIQTLCKSLVSVLEECINELKINEDGALAPTSRCSLPQIYFLDDEFYIETSLEQKNGIKYELKVELHKTIRAGSLGVYLTNTLKQNYNKITPFESNLLSSKVRKMPEEIRVRGDLLLVKKISFKRILKHFSAEREELEALEYEGLKPLSIFIPITMNLVDYSKYKDLFTIHGAMIECYNPETNEILPIEGEAFISKNLHNQ